jgi:hypothetical protein
MERQPLLDVSMRPRSRKLASLYRYSMTFNDWRYLVGGRGIGLGGKRSSCAAALLLSTEIAPLQA